MKLRFDILMAIPTKAWLLEKGVDICGLKTIGETAFVDRIINNTSDECCENISMLLGSRSQDSEGEDFGILSKFSSDL